jgi:MazG family protein
MAKEEGKFGIDDSLDAICEKLVRRHPHIFADAVAKTPDDVKVRWDQIKSEEKKQRGDAPRPLLASVPRNLPALMEAQQIASKAAGVGFDWDSIEQVIAKLHEELDELRRAREGSDSAEIEDELGDMLFVIVNMARFLKVDPEQALRRTNAKFRRRFGYVEAQLAGRGRKLTDSHIDEMEELWQEAKQSDG